MNEKTYVTKEGGRGLDFGYDYKQCFHHDSSQAKTLPEYTLVKQFTELSSYEKQLTLEVLKFLYQFTFATHDQLIAMLEAKCIDPAGMDEVIDQMLRMRQMNSFYLNSFAKQNEPFPDDAFVIYCIDFGAIAILSHFSNSDCIAWFTTDVVRSTELILKYLTTVMFYLALAEVKGSALRYFKPVFDVTFGHRSFRFSAAFEVMHGYTGHPFILESIRSYDLPANWIKKVDRQIVPFSCQEKNWTKYFSTSPVYILLVENEEQALEAADLFHRRTGLDNFRLITDAQVKNGLEAANFLKYIPNPDGEGLGTLQKVKASLLSSIDA